MSLRGCGVAIVLGCSLVAANCGADPHSSVGSRDDYLDEYATIDQLVVENAEVVVDPYHRSGYVTMYVEPTDTFEAARDVGLPTEFVQDEGGLATRFVGQSPVGSVTCVVSVEPEGGDDLLQVRVICSDPPNPELG